MSRKTTGRLVGAFIPLAYIVYLAGGGLVDAGVGIPAELSQALEHQTQIGIGALLMLANSVFVIGIGLLAYPAIVNHDGLAARTYVITRVVEAVLLGVGVLFVLLLIPLARGVSGGTTTGSAEALGHTFQAANRYAVQIGMIALGLGSLLFCRALYRARIVPRLVAIWGVVGYIILAAGEAYGILGYEGMLHYAIGGAFEVFLGVWLLVKGFPTATTPELLQSDSAAVKGVSSGTAARSPGSDTS